MEKMNVKVVKVTKKGDKEETSPMANCDVVGLIGGRSGGKTRIFRSGDKGAVEISWKEGKYLRSISVNGKCYDGHYLPGRSYTIKVYTPGEMAS